MSKKIVSFCLLLMILFTLAVPVFAAEVSIDNWYNTQQPYNESIAFFDSKGAISTVDYSDTGLTYTNPAKTSTSQMSFRFVSTGSVDGWELAMVDSFDYYLNLIVFSETDSKSEFTYFPGDMYIEYSNHDGHNVNTVLEDVNISHYDTAHYLGFSCTGRIPNNEYFGCPIRMLRTYRGTGSYPANIRAFIIIYQVPKSADGVSVDAAAIVDAINSQTQQLTSLIQGNGGDQDADAANSELSEVIGQVDHIEQDIHHQAQEAFNAADSIVNQFDPAAFSNAGNLYKQLSQNAFSSLGLISVFILIPLILFCVGAFIGKLK